MAATPDMVRAINGSTADNTIIEPFIIAAECVLVQIINNGCHSYEHARTALPARVICSP